MAKVLHIRSKESAGGCSVAKGYQSWWMESCDVAGCHFEIFNTMVEWEPIKSTSVNPQGFFVMNKPVLIIDDDQSVRRALRLLLESHGFACKEADDGLEGLALLDGGLSVDVVLSDYHMPVMDGVNFLKALVYRVNGQRVKVILLSGNMTKKMERIARQAGAFEAIAKPYDPQELLSVISRACNRPMA